MNIERRVEDNVLVLKLSGELMAGQDADQLRTLVDQAILEEQVNVVADMASVTWMNSSGLGLLISALTSLRSSEGDLRLANLSEKVKRPIKITKLDKVFQEYDTVPEAIASYTS